MIKILRSTLRNHYNRTMLPSTKSPFWEGLLRVSPLSVITLLLTFVVLSTGYIAFLSSFSPTDGYWVAHPQDDYGQLYRQVSSLPTEPHRAVYLIGSSATREAIVSPKELQRLLGPTTPVQLLMAGDLYPVEMAQIVARLPVETAGVLVLEISLRNFSLSPEKMRSLIAGAHLPVAPLRYQRLLLQNGFAPPIFPNLLSFMAVRVNPSLRHPVAKMPWMFHQVETQRPPTDEDWTRIINELHFTAGEFQQHRERNLAFFRALLKIVPPNLKIALLDAPRNPDVLARATQSNHYLQAQQTHQQMLVELADELDIEVWSLHQDIPSENFLDDAHINTLPARITYTNALADNLRRLRETP